ncbi:prepilin peptidase [Roseinatronobacter alkalisoli]|uniref:A24 family peptidase n=1 Tax=Roseinatronobacter alkalisoli TaxID=3028235 RepID=A0ABT5TFD6_9RHOB|nr:A24 family peptidase [Roseinatronobacter sp. HJB301]MDD7973716.1 A24 family peptidase [Roseinatronobacter sp. HJB301]
MTFDKTLHLVLGLYVVTAIVLLPEKAYDKIASVVLLPVFAALSVIDLRRHVIPDWASATVAVIGLGHGHLSGNLDGTTLIFAAGVLVVLWAGSEAYWRLRQREALGLGDVKLLAASSILLGQEAFWFGVMLACVGGIVAGLLSGSTRGSGIPFGPFIAYGVFLTFLIWS